MELAQILRTLRRRKLALTFVILLAVLAALATGYHLSPGSPYLKTRSVASGEATTQILIDSPQSAIADLKQDTAPLVTRATVFAQFMTSSTIRDGISSATGIPARLITAQGPFSGAGETQNVVAPSEARGGQVKAETAQYRLTFVAQEQLPLVSVYANAPTAAEAAKLANGVFTAVNAYVDQVANADETNPEHRVTVRQLGSAGAATVHKGGSKPLMVMAFLAVMIFGTLIIIMVAAIRQRGAAVDGAVEEHLVDPRPYATEPGPGPYATEPAPGESVEVPQIGARLRGW